MSYQQKFQDTLRDGLAQAHHEFEQMKEEEKHQTEAANGKDELSTPIDQAMTDFFHPYFDKQPDSYNILSEEESHNNPQEIDPDADYTVILDEIDGTANMQRETSHYGPLLGIAEESDPAFNNIIAMGFLDLQTGDLYEAYKDGGAYRTRKWGRGNRQTEQIQTSGRTTLGGKEPASILLDQYMLGDRSELAELWQQGPCRDYGCTGKHLALVADGSDDVMITGDHCSFYESKHETAEELGSGYLLITEAGGVITDWDGNDIGEETIRLHEEKSFNVIAAATEELADELAATYF
jgi:fructose-1,6-bisphosphatase/inositol monophosphatase family enzyme